MRKTSGKECRRYFVRGRVQGVGFRAYVQHAASAVGVRGYCRNLDDGRVEVYAEGTREELDEFASWLWKGPRMSEVRGVEEAESAPEPVSDFHIRH